MTRKTGSFWCGVATVRRACQVLGVLATVMSQAALAETFVLERVIIESRNGESPAIPEREVRFEIDPESGRFATDRIIVAPFNVGRRGYTRVTLKFDDLRGAGDGSFEIRSFECAEGTLGTATRSNFCGSYRFGTNDTDDGGTGDDIRVGTPVSLDGFVVSLNAEVDDRWVITLAAESPDASTLFPVYAIRFVLRESLRG